MWFALFVPVAGWGFGVAAINTGNNLLYMLVRPLLALIVVSGIFSRVRRSWPWALTGPSQPEEAVRGPPALLGAHLAQCNAGSTCIRSPRAAARAGAHGQSGSRFI